jgi:hypothetical protein
MENGVAGWFRWLRRRRRGGRRRRRDDQTLLVSSVVLLMKTSWPFIIDKWIRFDKLQPLQYPKSHRDKDVSLVSLYQYIYGEA